MDVPGVVAALRGALLAGSEVRSAWLFGSFASGRSRRDSDVDVGVWMESDCTFVGLADLSAHLQRATGLPVDLIILNRATPLLALDAVNGVPILTRDEASELEWVLQVARDAEDWDVFIHSFVEERRRSREAVRT